VTIEAPDHIQIAQTNWGVKLDYKLQVKGLTASQVVRLIGLLLVFASQKIVHNVRNEMAESIVPLRNKKNQGQSD